MLDFRHERNRHGHVWYRWFNELPVPILIGIVLLVVGKPQ
jgi:putative membrane protein